MNLLMVVALVSPLAMQIHARSATPDQFVVTGVKVVFFGPTQAQQDSIVRSEGLETAKFFDDFDYFAGKVSAFVKKRGIGVVHTTSSLILVALENKKVRQIDRRSNVDALGVILTDGVQEPKVIPGGSTDEELIAECTEFFRLK